MRRLSLIFLLFLCYAAHAQRAPKFAIDAADWITDDLEGSLTFYKNQPAQTKLNNQAVAEFGIYAATGKFQITKDTLMITHEYEGGDNLDTTRQHHVQRFAFLIKRIDKEKLILSPVVKRQKTKMTEADSLNLGYTDYAGRERMQQSEYYFTNLQYAIDKSFRFKRIYFKAGPGILIQIDSQGSYYLDGDGLEDAKFNGRFKGVLNGKQLDTLNNLLKRSQIRKMKDWPNGRFGTDGTEYDLQIDYNDDSLGVKTDTWPICITELIAFLEESYKKVTLASIKVGKE